MNYIYYQKKMKLKKHDYTESILKTHNKKQKFVKLNRTFHYQIQYC